MEVGLNGGGTIGRQVGRVEEDLLGGWRGRVEGGGLRVEGEG